MWWVIRPLLVSLVSCATITGKLKDNPYEAPEFIGLQVVLDDGYTGFITKDGSFNVHQVPVGTYVLNVVGSKLTYPPVRVDVGNSGSVRARKLNILSLKEKELLPYPLELEPIAKTPYFQKRETFSIFDQLKNPMVLFMVLPMLLVFMLPKLMDLQDPEIKKEMEEQMKTMKKGSQLPDASELMSNFFGGGAPEPKKSKKKKN